jgi:hypothetical protein
MGDGMISYSSIRKSISSSRFRDWFSATRQPVTTNRGLGQPAWRFRAPIIARFVRPLTCRMESFVVSHQLTCSVVCASFPSCHDACQSSSVMVPSISLVFSPCAQSNRRPPERNGGFSITITSDFHIYENHRFDYSDQVDGRPGDCQRRHCLRHLSCSGVLSCRPDALS